MPRLSAWFIRASLLYLLVGFTLGALMLVQKGIPYFAAIWVVSPIHVEFLLMGWLMQLAMGVAFWILPRFGRGAPRGGEGLIWVSFALINAGILLAAAQLLLPALLLAGRACELAGVLVYVAGSWRRVKPMIIEGLPSRQS